jgi:hypothetical protein
MADEENCLLTWKTVTNMKYKQEQKFPICSLHTAKLVIIQRVNSRKNYCHGNLKLLNDNDKTYAYKTSLHIDTIYGHTTLDGVWIGEWTY